MTPDDPLLDTSRTLAPDQTICAGTPSRCLFNPEASNYPFGVHAAVVEIDVDTGIFEIARYLAINDSGVMMNPTIVGDTHVGLRRHRRREIPAPREGIPPMMRRSSTGIVLVRSRTGRDGCRMPEPAGGSDMGYTTLYDDASGQELPIA